STPRPWNCSPAPAPAASPSSSRSSCLSKDERPTVLIPGLILVGTYAVLALGRLPGLRLDRTGAAVVGAILMVAFGGLSFDAAVQAVNFRTLVLLFGMMVLVAHLQLSGFFSRVARFVALRVHHPVALIFAVSA